MPAQKRALPENYIGEEEQQQDRHEEDFNRVVRQLISPIPKQICLEHVEAEAEDEEEEEEEEEEEGDDGDDDENQDEEEETDKAEDSEESPSSSPVLKPEFVLVGLPDIRKDVQCPICLGIIKKTRTVMECLHRFCRECIDKSMRMGNNECPACRTHCASRRSLRDDPNYDALIAILYPDIDKYEEEELAFHEEDQTRNKQIQASIAQIYQRQSEALIKRRTPGRERDSQETYMTRTQRNNRNSYLRRRSSGRTSEDNNEDGNANNDESSNDTEVRQRRRRRRNNNRSSAESPSSERLAWGRGGARSHTRHKSWSSRNTRLSKLVDYLRNLEESIDGVLDVNLVLVSLDKKITPSLEQPHLSCRASLSVNYLCQYVARQTPLKAEEVEILVVKGQRLSEDDALPGKDDVQILGVDETLGEVRANCTSTRDHLILVYRRKKGDC